MKRQKASTKKQKHTAQKNACLIILDGEIRKKLLLKYLTLEDKPVVISADGASNILYKWKIIPDYISGDLDSISLKTLSYFKKKKVKIKRVKEQEHNDFEKCIMLALSKKIKNITVIGYGGKRTDHMLNNFSVMKKYYKKCRIKLIDSDFEIFFAKKINEINCKKGDAVSLIAFPKATGITINGLQYSLKNERLELGVREGALNKAISRKVRIKFKKGDLLIFKKNNQLTNQFY